MKSLSNAAKCFSKTKLNLTKRPKHQIVGQCNFCKTAKIIALGVVDKGMFYFI